MTRIAYFDCFSGCSGDMILGALLDAGLSLDTLREGLAALNVSGYRISTEKVMRSSIAATKFNVITDEHSHHHHRPLSEILGIIDDSSLSESVKDKTRAVFQRLGKAEAKVHNIDIEQVHFHELGAIDTIVDIAGTIYALEVMRIERCYSSPLPAGNGVIKTAHGILPVPAPATLEILAESGASVRGASSASAPTGELVTPTGAVLITSLAIFSNPDMMIEKTGYGAGSKELPDRPNVLRVWIGETDAEKSDELVLLETNIDDMNPQIYGYLMEKMFAEKAADVWFTPIQMKKNRPAIMLSVLASAAYESRLTEIIIRETSTLGVRVRPVSRHTAQREIAEVETSLGRVRVKVKRTDGEAPGIAPEYEDCRRIAMERNLPFQEVYRVIEAEARRILG